MWAHPWISSKRNSAKTIRTMCLLIFFFVWLRYMYWNRADLPVTQQLLSMSNNKNSWKKRTHTHATYEASMHSKCVSSSMVNSCSCCVICYWFCVWIYILVRIFPDKCSLTGKTSRFIAAFFNANCGVVYLQS